MKRAKKYLLLASGISISLLSFSSGPVSAAGAADSGDAQTASTYDIASRKAKSSDIFSFDYGVPASPALALAGLTSAKITPATTLKPFVLSLPGFFDSNSSQTTAAFDFAPGWLAGQGLNVGAEPTDLGNQKSYQTQSNWFYRMLYRSRIGAALYRGDDGGGDAKKAKPSQAAFGFSTSLADTSDPLLALLPGSKQSAWLACLSKADSALAVAVTPEAVRKMESETAILQFSYKRTTASTFGQMPTSEQTELEAIEGDFVDKGELAARAAQPLAARIDADFKDARAKTAAAEKEAGGKSDTQAIAAIANCRKEASTAAQHGMDLEIGAGAVMSGDAGKLKHLQDPNASVWVAGRLPLDAASDITKVCGDDSSLARHFFRCWVVGGTGHYSSGQMIATGNTATPSIDARILEGWGGVERIDKNMKLGAYAGYIDQRATNNAQQALVGHGVRWLVSADFSLNMISDGMWVQGSYGNSNGSITALDDKVFTLSLSFGPSSIGSGFVQK